MMALKLNQSAILTGLIDAFCLTCDSPISGEDEAAKHMSLPSHKKNLETTSTVERYKDDKILKVKQGYYCTLCNLLFATLTKVGLHIAETEHKMHRGSNILKRTGSCIKFGDIAIEERAWQGFAGEMCVVCNAEYDDETEHLADVAHALNLAKNKVEFDGESIYRKIDDTTFQCITCNSVLPLKDIEKHFEDSQHKNNLLKQIKFDLTPKISKDEIKDVELKNDDSDNSSNWTDCVCSSECSSDEFDSDGELITKEYNTSKILESVSAYEKSEVNINFERETALCKKCLGNIEFHFKSIEKHIDEHRRNPTKRDVGYVAYPCQADMKVPKPNLNDNMPHLPAIAATTAETVTVLDNNHNEIDIKPEKATAPKNSESVAQLKETPEDFAKRNSLTYNNGNHNAFCRICAKRVPSSFRSMQEHVTGNSHQKKLSINQARSSESHTRAIRKMPMEDYVNEIFTIQQSWFSTVKVINDKICLGASSFHLITVNGDRLRCQVCEIFLRRSDMSSHVESPFHMILFKKVPVVYTFVKEFIREVRPGIFHCGYCNIMDASVEGIEVHLQSDEHKYSRTAAMANLASHRPSIEDFKQRRALERLAQFMLGGRFGF